MNDWISVVIVIVVSYSAGMVLGLLFGGAGRR